MELPAPSGPGSVAAPGSSQLPSKRSRPGMLAGAAVLTVAAVVVGVAVANRSGSPRPAPAMSPVAFVTSSAGRTLAERTADVTVTGSVGVSGQRIAIQGAGEVNFATNAMDLDASFNASGHAVEEKEILVDRSLYYSFTVDGKSAVPLTGGRSWIQMPVQQSGSANIAGSSPASSLRVLAQQGNAVRKLGTKIVDGVTCTGYAVTPSVKAMLAAAKKESAELGLPAAMSDLEQNLVRTMSPTLAVWIDAQGLVHEMSLNLQMTTLGSAASATVVMDFTHFGAPVHITAPAPSDTISYKSFLQRLDLNGLFASS
jgi:hypothetical protein